MYSRDVNEQEAHTVQSQQTDTSVEGLLHRGTEQNLHDRHIEPRYAVLRTHFEHTEIR